MKLFLASSADKTVYFLKELIPNIGRQVLFISNAADPYEGDISWVDRDREAFKKLGYAINEVDLRTLTPDMFKKSIDVADIVHMCGGSVYYIVALLRERDLEQILTDAIISDQVVYSGTSAGSIIVSRSIKAFSYDVEEEEHTWKVPSHAGLGLINFGIVPHCNNGDFVGEHTKMIEQMPNDPTPLFFLHDAQAIWVNGDSLKVLEYPC